MCYIGNLQCKRTVHDMKTESELFGITMIIVFVSAQTYAPALLNINYMHAESLSMRMDRNRGINAFRVELLRVGGPFRDTG